MTCPTTRRSGYSPRPTPRRSWCVAKALARYAEQGQIVPTVVLPSGHYRSAMSDVRRQLRELRERDPGE